MNVVVSQPMFFPWVGLFEQIRLADIYVHYGDVQFSKGSFVNRVQIKTSQGVKWLTVPLEHLKFGQTIDEVRINSKTDWRSKHLNMLTRAYVGAKYQKDMLSLVEEVYSQSIETIGDLSRASIERCCRYLGFATECQFLDIRDLGVSGKSSQRVLDIVKLLNGTKYITGLGASNYLDHQLFEDEKILVEYMDYQKVAYPQLHGEFTPYVSILDMIANVGIEEIECLCSGTINWKEYLNHE